MIMYTDLTPLPLLAVFQQGNRIIEEHIARMQLEADHCTSSKADVDGHGLSTCMRFPTH